MKKEPAVLIGAVGTLVAAFVTLLVSFGVPLSEEQADGIQNFVIVALPFCIALAIRAGVFSPASVEELLDVAAEPDTVEPDQASEEAPAPRHALVEDEDETQL